MSRIGVNAKATRNHSLFYLLPRGVCLPYRWWPTFLSMKVYLSRWKLTIPRWRCGVAHRLGDTALTQAEGLQQNSWETSVLDSSPHQSVGVKSREQNASVARFGPVPDHSKSYVSWPHTFRSPRSSQNWYFSKTAHLQIFSDIWTLDGSGDTKCWRKWKVTRWVKLTAMYVSILKIKTNSRLGIKLLHHDQKILSNRYWSGVHLSFKLRDTKWTPWSWG